MTGPRPIPDPVCSMPLIVSLMLAGAVTALSVAAVIANHQLRRLFG